MDCNRGRVTSDNKKALTEGKANETETRQMREAREREMTDMVTFPWGLRGTHSFEDKAKCSGYCIARATTGLLIYMQDTILTSGHLCQKR